MFFSALLVHLCHGTDEDKVECLQYSKRTYKRFEPCEVAGTIQSQNILYLSEAISDRSGPTMCQKLLIGSPYNSFVALQSILNVPYKSNYRSNDAYVLCRHFRINCCIIQIYECLILSVLREKDASSLQELHGVAPISEQHFWMSKKG